MLNLIQRTYSNRFRKTIGGRKSDLDSDKQLTVENKGKRAVSHD